jgi:activator of 2-hydroxyglutaryl-CoA dehydratase
MLRLKSGAPKREELPASLVTPIVLRSIARLTSYDIEMNTNNTNLTLTFVKQIKKKEEPNIFSRGYRREP